MTKLTEDLFALQGLLRAGENASPEQQQEIERLRAGVPEAVLAHFFRQLATGRRGIAFVRNGVCSACHLRLPHGVVPMLGRTNEVLVCESCGAFVALAPEFQSAAQPAPSPKTRRVAKKIEVLAS